MKKNKLKIIATACCISATLNSYAFTSFITRDRDQLKDSKNIFRFISVNTPNINGHYDGYKNTNPESGYIHDPIELSFEIVNDVIKNCPKIDIVKCRKYPNY